MRVLGMISSPRGLPALDVGGERERLEEALRPHLDSGRVELKWLDEVTWTGVHRKLLEEQWHVLHFVGHGTYDVETDEGVLAFVGRDGRADYVTASSLADLLDEAEPTPRLVVLNSCQSGAGGTTDLFSGTAAALAHSGIRAVAAMQFSISDTAAIEFARGFYTALAYGRGIDEAVRSGRIGILGMGRGTLEWVTPVLYLRGEDTQLFDVAPLPPANPEATRPVAARSEPLIRARCDEPRAEVELHSGLHQLRHPRRSPSSSRPPRSSPSPRDHRGRRIGVATASAWPHRGCSVVDRITSEAAALRTPTGPPRPSSRRGRLGFRAADHPPPRSRPDPERRPHSSPPDSSPPTAAPRPSTPGRKPWLVVGLIAVVAIAGSRHGGLHSSLRSSRRNSHRRTRDPLDRGPDGQATDGEDIGVLVKEDVVPLTELDFSTRVILRGRRPVPDHGER